LVSVIVGYGTRRGLGRVRVAVKELRWRWYGADPREQGALAPLPALGDLATVAEIKGDYGWQEPAAAGPTLALEVRPGLVGWEATLRPEAGDGPEGTAWDKAPWPALAAPLPPALLGWPRREEVLP
jgi:hypothetical protein